MDQPLAERTVAVLETRRREELAALIRRRGGTPLLAPALQELPAEDPGALAAEVQRVAARPFDLAVFQTGVGTAAFLAAAAAAGCREELERRLAAAQVVARGPKPLAALQREGIRVECRTAEPHTTAEVIALIDPDLRGRVALVVEYGAVNAALHDALERRGAEVLGVTTYGWGLPADAEPLRQLLSALEAGTVDAVLVTSASQVHNLFRVADAGAAGQRLAGWLNQRTVVAAIGPVSAAALRDHGVRPAVQPEHPKMVPLLDALCAHLAPGSS